MAAMPAWDLEAWLDSLGMQRLVTKSVLGRVQASLDGFCLSLSLFDLLCAGEGARAAQDGFNLEAGAAKGGAAEKEGGAEGREEGARDAEGDEGEARRDDEALRARKAEDLLWRAEGDEPGVGEWGEAEEGDLVGGQDVHRVELEGRAALHALR